MSFNDSLILQATTWVLPILFAITLHEAAHAYAARALGDDTAQRLGRLSLNPLRHVDRFGTIILPALLILIRAPFVFGWAKPVPVDMRRFGDPRRDMMLVALAGPAINIALAFLSAILLNLAAGLGGGGGTWVGETLRNSILLNLILAIFNMIPLPPLDGSKVLYWLLPARQAFQIMRFERYGLFVFIGIAFLVPLIAAQAGFDFNPVFDFLGWALNGVLPIFQEVVNL